MEWNPLVPELTAFDFERSLEFYTKILGFSVKFTREGFAYLEQEGMQFMLEQYHEGGWNTGRLEPPLGRGINFQIELQDIAPIYERLKTINYPLYRDSKDVWRKTGNIISGQREFLLQDFDGYLLRFCHHLGERSLETSEESV
jgi:catechol 2,3-dioxygenase-like lactoylglutathione lyase family enzyme